MEEENPNKITVSVWQCKINALDENALPNINKQIFEIKKKIQLSEGQRKALFEDCEAERKSNCDEILRLKSTIAVLINEIKSARGLVDPCRVPNLNGKKLAEVAPITRKTYEKARDTFDLKVIDLKKQLDVIRYKTVKKEKYMKSLAEERQKLIDEQDKKPKKVKDILKGHPIKKKLISLENEIHRTEIQSSEARHMRNKYKMIKTSLSEDSVRFEKSLKKIEEVIQAQEKEIQHLQKIYSDAVEIRNMIRSTLDEEQNAALTATRNRERQLFESRQRVEARKRELERLERRIAAQSGTARSLTRDTIVSTSHTLKTGAVSGHREKRISSPKSDIDEEEDSDNEEELLMQESARLDSEFKKLKQATGSIENEEVLARFKGQKETLNRLMLLRKTTEKEKENLETAKERMITELEMFKFLEAKDKEKNIEMLENINQRATTQQQRYEEIHEAYENSIHVTNAICTSLYNMCVQLKGASIDSDPDSGIDLGDDPPNDSIASEELLNILEKRLLLLFFQDTNGSPDSGIEDSSSNIDKLFLTVPKIIAEDKSEMPTSYMALTASKSPVSVAGPQHMLPTVTIASDDEEDVPSRGYLKRQAQLIVDAKSRRKTFRVQLPRRK